MFSNCGARRDFWEALGLGARRSNQSTLKEINPEYSLEGLMLKLNLQCFGYWERLNIGGEGNNRRIRWLDGITDSMDMNWSNLRETVKNRELGILQFIGSQRVGHISGTEQWTRNKLMVTHSSSVKCCGDSKHRGTCCCSCTSVVQMMIHWSSS